MKNDQTIKMTKLSNKILAQSLVVLFIGLLLTALLCWKFDRVEKKEIAKLMHDRASVLQERIQKNLFLYQYGLRGLRGGYVSVDDDFLSYTRFTRYTESRDYPSEFPGALGFGFIRRVKPEQEAGFITSMRLDHRPQFTIKQINPHLGDKFVIELIAPLDENAQAVGLDIASETNRFNAARRSMLSGELTITAPITLVQKQQQKSSGFLIMLPYYANNVTPATVEERERLLLGWVYAPLVINQIVGVAEINRHEDQVELLDVTDISNPITFFSLKDGASSLGAPIRSALHPYRFTPLGSVVLDTNVFGRKWQLKYTGEAALKKYTGVPSVTLTGIVGVLISLLMGFVWYFWRNNHQKEQLVISGQARIAAIVESSINAIIGKTLEGRITSWNKGAEALFGYTESEAVGQLLMDLVVPEQLYEEERSILATIAQGRPIPAFDTVRLNKLGEKLQVSVSVAPVRDAVGNIVGAAKTVRDITEQKKAEREILQLNKELEQKVVERTAELQGALSENNVLIDAIKTQFLYSLTNHRGEITDVNQAFCDIHGYSREELLGKNHRILSSGVLSRSDWENIWNTIETNHSWHGEMCNISKQGNHLWFDSVIVKLAAENPEQVRYLSIRIDVTAKRAQDQQMLELNALLKGILDAASEVSIIATDPQGVIEVFNTGAERMLGYTAQEVVGVKTPAIIHLASEVEARGDELTSQFGQPIHGFRTFVHVPEIIGAETREWTYVRKNGSQLPVSLSVTANRSSNGEILGYLGIAIDLSEEKQQRVSLMRLLEKMQLAAKVAQLGIWEWDIQKEGLVWNDEMFAIYDYPLEEKDKGLCYEHWRQRLHPDDEQRAVQQILRAANNNEVFDSEFRVVWPSGEVRYVKALAVTERDPETNKPLVMIGVNFDVTLERNHAGSLLQAKLDAEHANLAKTQFLADMSHEIRTPLNAVMGMLQLLQRTELQQRQVEYITKAKSSAQSLLEILNDILDISKIEAGKLELEKTAFTLESMLRELADIGSAYQGGKPIELVYKIDPLLRNEVIGDQLRLKQVLINLMGNAIKFTDKGNVTIGLRLLQMRDGEADIRLSVSDTGIGIAEHQIPKLFQNFSQAESATSRKYGGTGLGLAICNKILQLMNSTLRVESRVGEGSTFFFDLSLPIVSEVGIVHHASSSKLKLLLVDDNHVSTEAISSSLPVDKFDVVVVHSPTEAIHLFELAQESVAFDVVLMDINLPEMSGIEAANQILQKTDKQHAPVIIMISAHELEKYLEGTQPQDLPFSSFLSKPFTPQQVIDAVEQVMSGKPSHLTFAPSSSGPVLRLKGVRIMVVEDNALNRLVAQELLESEGAIVQMEVGGKEAIEQLMATEVDLILMDLQMPEMDGFEATRRIRQFNQKVPIVALTANATTEDRQTCLDVGMSDHIGKPLNIDRLVEVVLKHASADWDANHLAVKQKQETSASAEVVESLDSILKRFNNKAETYLRSLALFNGESRSFMTQIEAAAAENNHKVLGSLFHAIKGSSATVGGTALAKVASSYEQLAKRADLLTIVVSAEDLADFGILLEQTITLLQSQSEKLNQVIDKPTAKSVILTKDELIVILAKMSALLDSNNMEALELSEELLVKSSPDMREQLSHIVEAVQNLKFDYASLLIKELTTGHQIE